MPRHKPELAHIYNIFGLSSNQDLEAALETLKAWARKYCQPDFFTVEAVTPHIITSEEVQEALARY